MINRLHKFARKVWPLVVLAAVCGAVVGCLITFGGNPTYTSKATFYVAPPISSSPMDAVSGDLYAANRTQLYLQLIKSEELAKRVADKLQSSETPGALNAKIGVTGSHQAPLLTIKAKGPSPEAAKSLAQAYMDQLPEYAQSVEQNSGLREGPVVVPVEGPTEATADTTGVQAWIRVLFSTAVFGCAALAYAIWYRHRNPTARNIEALRSAMPASFVGEVCEVPADLLRLQAMLFAAPNSPRRMIFASARRTDALEEFTAQFAGSLHDARIPYEHVNTSELDGFRNGAHSDVVVVFDSPAILDGTNRIAALAAYSSTAVIVARGAETLVKDIVELDRLLGLNGIDVKGVINVDNADRMGGKRYRKVNAAADEITGGPWPAIEALEVATSSRKMAGPSDD